MAGRDLTAQSDSSAGGQTAAIALSVSLATAIVYDVETTFHALGDTVREGNPLMRPLVQAGRIPTYAVTLGVSAFAVYGANRLRLDGRWWWWIPLAGVSALHLTAGTLNLRFVL